ncbi:MAG: YcxB family protein [Opitutales bacterium]
MTFRYSIELADQLAFTRYHLAHSERVKRHKRKGLLVMVPLFLCIAAALAFLPGYWALFALLPVGLTAVYLWGYSAAYERWVLLKTEEMAAKDGGRRFGREQKITILPEGIAVDTPDGTQGLRWNQIREVVIDREHIFLYFNEVNALIIPEARVEGAPFEQVAATIQDYAQGNGPGQQTVTFS